MENLKSVVSENGLVFPDYNNSNLSVFSDIVNGKGKTANKDNTVFMVVDGMGYNLIKNLLVDMSGSALSKAQISKVSTVFPSSTITVLTSIETGLTPSMHGLVGWNVYSRDIGSVIMPYRESLTLSTSMRLSHAGIDIKGMFPEPKLFIKAAKNQGLALLLEKGVRMPYQGTEWKEESYTMQSDMLIKLRDIVKEEKHGVVYVYYSVIDSLEHAYGPHSDVVRNGLALLFTELEKVALPAIQKHGYNLVITADHGQTRFKETKINSRSTIMNYLTGPPWGDKRCIFFNVASGKEDDAEKYISKRYGDDFILIKSESAIASGVFGSKRAAESIRYRFGTHIMIAKGNAALKYEYVKEDLKPGKKTSGTHSGLSKDEMEVPLIVY